jgi:hypothetical protein
MLRDLVSPEIATALALLMFARFVLGRGTPASLPTQQLKRLRRGSGSVPEYEAYREARRDDGRAATSPTFLALKRPTIRRQQPQRNPAIRLTTLVASCAPSLASNPASQRPVIGPSIRHARADDVSLAQRRGNPVPSHRVVYWLSARTLLFL